MGKLQNFFRSLFAHTPRGRSANGLEISNLRKQVKHKAIRRQTEEFFKPGEVIGGKFEVHHWLGEGGFGVVYLVYDRQIRGVVALKTFHNEFLADATAREVFKKEALLWVNLDEHAFILPAIYVNEISGRLFVATEYIAPDDKGRVSLQDHINQAQSPLDTKMTLQWAIQFCHGMEHANAHGIRAHRDIKPGNILIRQDETLKIMDFGLAAATEAVWKGGASVAVWKEGGGLGYSLLATEGKQVCGTPGHIAPEVYEGKGADVRSDIYAFGIVLWQMATGCPASPFHAAEVGYGGDDEIFLRKYQATVYEKQETGHVPQVEGPLWPVIQRCLSFQPRVRYENFRALRAVLEGMYGDRVKVPLAGQKTVGYWNNKGNSLRALGRPTEAIRCFDQALEIDRRYTDAWNGKGSILFDLGRPTEAIHCFDQALEIDRQSAAAWNNKGSVLANQGLSAEAIQCFNRALEIDRRLAGAWNNRANILKALGHPVEAIRCYDQSLEIDPRDARTWGGKGSVLAALGRNEEAIRCCDQALEIDPRDALAWISKGSVLGIMGRPAEAIRIFDQALEIDPRSAVLWTNKGSILGDLGRHEEAIYCYDKSLEIDPQSAATWTNKGNSLGALGQFTEAIRFYDQALDIDRRYALAWYNKALTEKDLGRQKDAAKSFRKFLDLEAGQYPQHAVQVREWLRQFSES